MKIIKLATLLVLTLITYNAFSASVPYSINATFVDADTDDLVFLTGSFWFDFNEKRILNVNATLTAPDFTQQLQWVNCGGNCSTTYLDGVSVTDFTDFMNNQDFDSATASVNVLFNFSNPDFLQIDNAEFSYVDTEEVGHNGDARRPIEVLIIPEPVTIALLAAGLFGIGVVRRKNNRL